MEFHRVTRAALANPTTPAEAVDQTVHIFSTTRADDNDTSPLQFVSTGRLQYYQRAEAVAAVSGALLVGGALVVAILYVRGFISF